MNSHINQYKHHIYSYKDINFYRYQLFRYFSELIRDKDVSQLSNHDLFKCFEYYSCIMLSGERKNNFQHYDDLDPEFKEENQMSHIDTGIDLCDYKDTIVQCKLYNGSIHWNKISNFLASQNNTDIQGNTYIRWKHMILARNSDSSLSENVRKTFIDKTFSKNDMISYCQKLIENPPVLEKINDGYETRDYQVEMKQIIDKTENCAICIPTGTGKNRSIISYMSKDKKYLILVPLVSLLEQYEEEIKEFRPDLSDDILLLGNSNKIPKKINKNVVVCIYNSYGEHYKLLKNFVKKTHKIFIDEAHHIRKPQIYLDSDSEFEGDDESDIDSDDDEEGSDIDRDVDESVSEDFNREDIEIISKTYIDRIIELKKFNNNVYLSATIDKIPDFNFYKKETREMIDKGYISDYTINIPIFEEVNDEAICRYLIQKHNNIIIYCGTRKDGMAINKILNRLNKGCSKYVDYKTSRNDRKKFIRKFKKNKINFLVNVRVFTEGFNCSNVMGVCFMKLPSNKVSLIQIIGRALRKHPNKSYAKVIIPYNGQDDKMISKFLKILSDNDYKLKQSLQKGKNSGRLKVEKVLSEEEDNDATEEYNEEKFKLQYEAVYNSVGEAIIDGWMIRLEKVEEYVKENKKWPSSKDNKEEIKSLGYWVQRQKTAYNNGKLKQDRKKKLEGLAEKYGLTFEPKKINESMLRLSWDEKLEKVEKYVKENKNWPSKSDKNEEIKTLGKWVQNQKTAYNNGKLKQDRKKKLEVLVKQYGLMFSKDETWEKRFEEVEKYVKENKNWPSTHDKNEEIKTLGNWVHHQKTAYNNGKLKQDRKKKLEDLVKQYGLIL